MYFSNIVIHIASLLQIDAFCGLFLPNILLVTLLSHVSDLIAYYKRLQVYLTFITWLFNHE